MPPRAVEPAHEGRARHLEAELTEHLGHEHGQKPIAGKMRNGTRTKDRAAVIEVPRDRNGSFEPVIVPKEKSRPRINRIVIPLLPAG